MGGRGRKEGRVKVVQLDLGKSQLYKYHDGQVQENLLIVLNSLEVHTFDEKVACIMSNCVNYNLSRFFCISISYVLANII